MVRSLRRARGLFLFPFRRAPPFPKRPCISSLLSLIKIVLQYEVVRGTAHHQGVVHVPPPPPPPSPLPIRLLLHLLTPPAQRPCISSLLSVTKIVLQYEVVRGIDSHTLTHPASPPPLGRVASITYMNDVTPSHPPYYPPIRSPPPHTYRYVR